jgi:hypothetical protein
MPELSAIRRAPRAALPEQALSAMHAHRSELPEPSAIRHEH